MTLLPLRLPPDADLRLALEALVAPGEATGCFVLSGIGSLVNPCLRLAGAAEATVFAGDYEITSLAGTVTAQGAHLHAVLAGPTGAVVGGHLTAGNRVRTTAEILLLRVEGWTMGRAPDPRTGFLELQVAPRASVPPAG